MLAALRFARSVALVVAALLAWAWGPLVVVVCVGLLAVPRVRRWLRPTRRVVAAWVVAIALVSGVLAGVVVLAPGGLLPVPPGAGALATARYAGSPAVAQPLDLRLARHPRLAVASTGAVPGPGPLGESPQVDTAWYGVQDCASLVTDSQGRLVLLCAGSDPELRVVDPGSLRTEDSLDLPGPADASREGLCGTASYLDDQDRVVVATTRRTLRVVATTDGEGAPDLTVQSSYDLTGHVTEGDCVVSVTPDWLGRTWWASSEGRVGFVDPGTGRVSALDLGEEVANPLSVSQDGGVFVVTTTALHRLAVDRAGRPEVLWRSVYDRGTRRKDGQLTRGSGSAPTLLPSGMVAITDNAEPRMNVQLYAADSGVLVCQRAVFADDESATEASLVPAGRSGVVVTSTAGSSSVRRTALGRTTPGGLARVDAADGTCDLTWKSELSAPGGGLAVSSESGLAYVVTKPRSLLGVAAWYLTALDVRTGRTRWSVRTGIGALLAPGAAPVTLGPDGAAYLATRGGLVRVRDRA